MERELTAKQSTESSQAVCSLRDVDKINVWVLWFQILHYLTLKVQGNIRVTPLLRKLLMLVGK